MKINAAGLSESDGARLRELLQLFAERTRTAREDYEQAKHAGLKPLLLVLRRARWKTWRLAWEEFAQAFDWSSVPSTAPDKASDT